MLIMYVKSCLCLDLFLCWLDPVSAGLLKTMTEFTDIFGHETLSTACLSCLLRCLLAVQSSLSANTYWLI